MRIFRKLCSILFVSELPLRWFEIKWPVNNYGWLYFLVRIYCIVFHCFALSSSPVDVANIVTRFAVYVYHLCVHRSAKDCVVCVGNEFPYFHVSSNCMCMYVCVCIYIYCVYIYVYTHIVIINIPKYIIISSLFSFFLPSLQYIQYKRRLAVSVRPRRTSSISTTK